MKVKALKITHPRQWMTKLALLSALALFVLSLMLVPSIEESSALKVYAFLTVFGAYVVALSLALLFRLWPISNTEPVGDFNRANYLKFKEDNQSSLRELGAPEKLDEAMTYKEYEELRNNLTKKQAMANLSITKAMWRKSEK